MGYIISGSHLHWAVSRSSLVTPPITFLTVYHYNQKQCTAFSRTLRRRCIAECSKGEVKLKVTIQSRVKFHRHPTLATTHISTTAQYNFYRSCSFEVRGGDRIGKLRCYPPVYFHITQKSKFRCSLVACCSLHHFKVLIFVPHLL